MADFWTRPSVFPTQPSIERTLPTNPPSQPTTPPQPTSPPGVNPTTPPVGGLPTSVPTQPPLSGGGSSSNPCAAGQSFVGPFCGWSPSVGGTSDGGSVGGTVGESGASTARVGGPQVLGLSNTSGSDLAPSDIILLAGVLCLTLYAKSKLTDGKEVLK